MELAVEATTPPPSTLEVTIGNGDFEGFYDRHAPAVAQALAVTLGDPELAADATAEAMTRAWQRWSKVGGYDNPTAWVYRVGLNWARSWHRRRRRERERPVALGPDRVESEVRDDRLDAALASLSVDHRAVVVCRLHLDWSVGETADALGIRPGTVKSRLARALAELRPHAESMEEDD
ncbi:MAG: sigma-70 family RNA polymerase sigma factor [Actinomycetota bacterium]